MPMRAAVRCLRISPSAGGNSVQKVPETTGLARRWPTQTAVRTFATRWNRLLLHVGVAGCSPQPPQRGKRPGESEEQCATCGFPHMGRASLPEITSAHEPLSVFHPAPGRKVHRGAAYMPGGWRSNCPQWAWPRTIGRWLVCPSRWGRGGSVNGGSWSEHHAGKCRRILAGPGYAAQAVIRPTDSVQRFPRCLFAIGRGFSNGDANADTNETLKNIVTSVRYTAKKCPYWHHGVQSLIILLIVEKLRRQPENEVRRFFANAIA